jgi:hypothetical protein
MTCNLVWEKWDIVNNNHPKSHGRWTPKSTNYGLKTTKYGLSLGSSWP